MKAKLFFLVLVGILSLQAVRSQISWQEDFTHPTFDHGIQWLGDTLNWRLENGKLRLDATVASPIWLSCVSTIAQEASWEFYIRLDFSPSAANYAEVYLMSDHPDPALAREAYWVRVGGTSGSSDDVSFYKRTPSGSEELIDGRDGIAGSSSVELNIKVLRDSTSQWHLYTDTSLVGNYELEGMAYDESNGSSRYFSLLTHFTSTRSNRFYFDNISVSGYPYVDTVAIYAKEIKAVDSNRLKLSFSEIPSATSALNTQNYSLLASANSVSIVDFDDQDSSVLILDFSSAFENGIPQRLLLQNIADRHANVMNTDTLSFTYYRIEAAQPSDIIINEIFADPSPIVGLPDAEYIELFNRSDRYIELKGFTISDPSRGGFLSDFVLFPNAHLVLCNLEDTAEFEGIHPLMGVEYFPSLNNSSDVLYLKDPQRNIIDSVAYESSDHVSSDKASGGWSLELINPFLNCYQISNWTSSTDHSGGSPAQQNSVFDTIINTSGPQLIQVEVLSHDSLQLNFDRALATESLDQANFELKGSGVSEVFISTDKRSLLLKLELPLDSGRLYQVRIEAMVDCEGYSMGAVEGELVLPSQIQKGDLVINELLFNPYPNGSDFVELLNNSNKIFSTKGLLLSNSKTTEEVMIDQLIYPSDHIVLTEDKQHLLDHYQICNSERILETPLPSLNDDEGSIILLRSDSVELESFFYTEEMHFPLLKDNEGVSLERIEPQMPAEATNFFSAAELVAFATPTCENSQYQKSAEVGKMLQLRKEIFSPDQDGYDDLLFIDYTLDRSGFVGSISVLDANGRMVKQLVNNELFSKRGSMRWDGIDQQGRKAPVGIYLLWVDLFHPDGQAYQEKIAFVLATFLD